MTTQDPLAALREAAQAVLDKAETDDDFEGQFVDYLVPAEQMDALRAALAATPPAIDPERLALRRVIALLRVSIDPSEDEAHEWCDVDSGGNHTFDRDAFERDAAAIIAAYEADTDA